MSISGSRVKLKLRKELNGDDFMFFVFLRFYYILFFFYILKSGKQKLFYFIFRSKFLVFKQFKIVNLVVSFAHHCRKHFVINKNSFNLESVK